MRAPVVDAGAHDLGAVAADFQPDPQYHAFLQRRRIEHSGNGLRHAFGIGTGVAGIGEGLDDVAAFGERDDVLGIGVGLVGIAGLRRHADILRHDLDAVGGGDRLGGKGVAEALGIDVMQRGDLHIAVGGEHRAGVAHRLLDLVGRQRAGLVEGRVDREVDGLQAHLAFDLGAIDQPGRRGRRLGGAVFGKDGERIEGRIAARRLIAGGERHLDLHQRHRADDIAVTVLDHRRDLEPPPVLGAGDLAQRRGSVGLGLLAGLVGLAHIEQVGDFRGGRQLLAPVQSGEQRHAHQHAGGDAGEKRSRQPAGRDLTAIGRAAAAVRNQWRLVAEIGYGVVAGLHSERRCFHVPEPLLSGGQNNCPSSPAKSTNGAQCPKLGPGVTAGPELRAAPARMAVFVDSKAEFWPRAELSDVTKKALPR